MFYLTSEDEYGFIIEIAGDALEVLEWWEALSRAYPNSTYSIQERSIINADTTSSFTDNPDPFPASSIPLWDTVEGSEEACGCGC